MPKTPVRAQDGASSEEEHEQPRSNRKADIGSPSNAAQAGDGEEEEGGEESEYEIEKILKHRPNMFEVCIATFFPFLSFVWGTRLAVLYTDSASRRGAWVSLSSGKGMTSPKITLGSMKPTAGACLGLCFTSSGSNTAIQECTRTYRRILGNQEEICGGGEATATIYE